MPSVVRLDVADLLSGNLIDIFEHWTNGGRLKHDEQTPCPR